jgi:propanol-preferring alcohol dehydrogenase
VTCLVDYLVYDGPSDKHGEWVQERVGGVQAAIVTAPLVQAYEEAFKSVKHDGRIVAVGLPASKISVSVLDFVLGGIQLIGSLVGTRKDVQETLELAKLHKIACKVEKCKLEDINQIFDDLLNYKISGRIVIDFTAK